MADDKKVIVDKNKSAQQYIEEAQQLYIVPNLVRDKFPDLVKLIFETESMNDEEREYWLQIMPVMTEEQIDKFRQILVNEKEELAKLDKEYDEEMSKFNKPIKELSEDEVKGKLEAIEKAEESHEEEEKSEEEELLKKLENI